MRVGSYVAVVIACLSSLAACSGKESEAGVDQKRDGGASVDGSQQDAAKDASAADGTYFDGDMLCCARGTGVSCCTAPGRLGYHVPDDGGAITPVGDQSAGPTANCFAYGGLGECVSEGQGFDRKLYCAICCDGLAPVPPSEVGQDGACMVTAPISAAVCLPCGNGRCDDGENRCNCPADCE